MDDKALNRKAAVTVIAIIASVICFVKGIFAWVDSQSFKIWFIIAVLLFIGGILYPLIKIIFETNSETKKHYQPV